MKFSSLHSALLAAFSLAWGEASAFGLGEIHSASRIGERLYAEIDLSVQPDERLDAGCVRLDKSQVGDGIPSLQLGSVSVRRGNSPVLVVRSAGFIQEPVLRLGLNVGCGFERCV